MTAPGPSTSHHIAASTADGPALPNAFVSAPPPACSPAPPALGSSSTCCAAWSPGSLLGGKVGARRQMFSRAACVRPNASKACYSFCSLFLVLSCITSNERDGVPCGKVKGINLLNELRTTSVAEPAQTRVLAQQVEFNIDNILDKLFSLARAAPIMPP